MGKEEILIEARNLSKYYPIKARGLFKSKKYVHAVESLNLKIPKGLTCGLVGESGCGKSTTGQMLAQIIQPTKGKVLYKGKELSNLKKEEQKYLTKNIQTIFQDPYASLNPKRKIGWTLEEPLINCTALDKEARQEKVDHILKEVGLDKSYKEKYPNELSGGQRQRVSIARALILEPEFVIADEAVSALDVSVQAQILNLMKKMQKARGLTYLFISHDLNVVQYMSDIIGVMYLGHLVEIGKAEEVYYHPAHPYTQALLSAVPQVDGNQQERIVLTGEVPNPAQLPTGCPFHTRCKDAKPCCKVDMPIMRKVGNDHFVYCHKEGGN